MLTLRLNQHWAEQLHGELTKAGTREMGGILMAEQLVPGTFTVADMTFQRHGGSFASFFRSANAAMRAVKKFFNTTNHDYQRFNYIGEWHSHPSFEPIPSKKDHDTMWGMMSDPKVGADFLVLFVTKLNGANMLEGSLTLYHHDGKAHPAEWILDQHE